MHVMRRRIHTCNVLVQGVVTNEEPPLQTRNNRYTQGILGACVQGLGFR